TERFGSIEPEWEARFDGRTYGFRPGHGCADAIGAIFQIACQKTAKRLWVLDADLSAAFDRISHSHLMDSIGLFPGRRQIRGWLRAGVMEQGTYAHTIEGTPQGGPVWYLAAKPVELRNRANRTALHHPEQTGIRPGLPRGLLPRAAAGGTPRRRNLVAGTQQDLTTGAGCRPRRRDARCGALRLDRRELPPSRGGRAISGQAGSGNGRRDGPHPLGVGGSTGTQYGAPSGSPRSARVLPGPRSRRGRRVRRLA
ncbi:group II intron reverse transcriptase domain-containing protein, partial [Streptomyces sp. ISL-112]|nr:group II intron reverse transcriptase domain-containing protein [Streptomyces sp. ISL-112]